MHLQQHIYLSASFQFLCILEELHPFITVLNHTVDHHVIITVDHVIITVDHVIFAITHPSNQSDLQLFKHSSSIHTCMHLLRLRTVYLMLHRLPTTELRAFVRIVCTVWFSIALPS